MNKHEEEHLRRLLKAKRRVFLLRVGLIALIVVTTVILVWLLITH